MSVEVSVEAIPITINFDNGDSETFYCYANRKGFASDFFSLSERISSRMNDVGISDVSVDEQKNVLINYHNESEYDQKKLSEEIDRINTIFEEELDRVFGSRASACIFKYNAPLSYHEGYKGFYFFGVLDAISKEIEKQIESIQVTNIVQCLME